MRFTLYHYNAGDIHKQQQNQRLRVGLLLISVSQLYYHLASFFKCIGIISTDIHMTFLGLLAFGAKISSFEIIANHKIKKLVKTCLF